MVPLFHPLCGVSPINACGLAATQALEIQKSSADLFAKGSQLAGVLTAPGSVSDPVAKRIQEHWTENFMGAANSGKVAVLGDGFKFEPMVMNAVDAQLIEQLKWSDEKICSVYHVPAYMAGIGAPPPYANSEPLLQLYYSQCLQSLIEKLEAKLEDGLGVTDAGYGL
jgi:HK97 family phage portal protein